MAYYKYGQEEIEYLKGKDPALGRLIDQLGIIKRPINRDVFFSLISSIISQQISTKAAETVEERLRKLTGEFTGQNISKLDVKEIQACGMSMRKAEYIKGIAEASINKEIDFKNLKNLPDKEVIKELSKLKGVGEWTAQMLLIHSLERQDVVAYKDLGIRRGMISLYKLDELTKEEFQKHRENYSPYGTIASFYLWELSRQI